MTKKNTLKAEDWIRGAFRALGAGGPQAIRVEAIARNMKVSKGSFYWHFRDLGTLKVAMLEHWVDIATFETIAKVAQKGEGAYAQLLSLIALATGDQSADYGGPRVEAAIREWARTEKSVAQIVEEVEAARLDFVASLFLKAGADGEASRQKARLLYGAMIGLEQLPGSEPEQVRRDLGRLLERLLDNRA
ncbi:MAG TPA: TetR/AcrR family transcriptional regulator [Devosia sp.]|nr:TetR/AcrR family transcriptional regulator [Devosia sp.]